MAAVLINIFALVTSLFSMVIYDRVVPNNAMASLTALAVPHDAGFAVRRRLHREQQTGAYAWILAYAGQRHAIAADPASYTGRFLADLIVPETRPARRARSRAAG